VRALRDAGTMNPVILLDEVDKVGADWRGDPSAALLEVLDPAQNHSFRDHYLDVELDLSQVMFIATANVAETIPGPLLDRMEVIRFDGYTVDEKVSIGRDYLFPRQRERNGLREDEVTVEDGILRTVVSEYTREAGVRQLERELGKVLRKTASRIATHESIVPVAVDLDAVREHCADVHSESFVPPKLDLPAQPSGGRVTFADSAVEVTDDGRSLLEQAESAGLNPANGCRMGICHTCTRRKNAGTVRSLTTGAVSSVPDEDIQICVSVPVGDVDLSL